MNFRSFSILFLFLLSTNLLCAQGEKTIPYCWATVGAGAANVQDARWEMSEGASGNVAFKKQLLGVRVLHNEEFVIFRTPLKVNETGIYYGRYFLQDESNAYAAVGGGLSFETYYTYGQQYYPPNSTLGTYHYLEKNRCVGLALDVQAGANFGRFVGLGLHAFASLNSHRSIGGILLSLRIGYLGEK